MIVFQDLGKLISGLREARSSMEQIQSRCMQLVEENTKMQEEMNRIKQTNQPPKDVTKGGVSNGTLRNPF
jgi:regulator of replication initiation timing